MCVCEALKKRPSKHNPEHSFVNRFCSTVTTNEVQFSLPYYIVHKTTATPSIARPGVLLSIVKHDQKLATSSTLYALTIRTACWPLSCSLGRINPRKRRCSLSRPSLYLTLLSLSTTVASPSRSHIFCGGTASHKCRTSHPATAKPKRPPTTTQPSLHPPTPPRALGLYRERAFPCP